MIVNISVDHFPKTNIFNKRPIVKSSLSFISLIELAQQPKNEIITKFAPRRVSKRGGKAREIIKW